MRTFATTNRRAENALAHLFSPGRSGEVPERENAPPLSSFFAPMIHRKASCACGGGCPVCQSNSIDLKVSEPNVPAEILADQIADRVMRMRADVPVKVNHHSPDPEKLHAKCSACEEDEELLLAKGEIADTTDIEPSFEDRINSLRGSGSPLPASVLNYFEPRFGYNFGGVRVHADAGAAGLARSANAEAFTLGRDIVFGAGRYAPQSDEGKRLLAHELAHVVKRQALEGRPLLWRQIANVDVAGVLDYERLARDVHEATEGWGTDEERVYGALQRLQRNPVAIARLEQEYLARYDTSLEAVIRDEFSGEELEYALQLIRRGPADSAQRVEAIPANNYQRQTAARRLHAAMEGLGTDEEAVFAVLTPFSRNATLLAQLHTVYAALYRESLHDRVVDEMSGSELDYALYLLGEERMETTEVGMAEATRLFTALSRVTLTDPWGVPIQVPFHYPVDGCYDRAHVMENVMTEMGYRVQKVFAVSKKQVGLTISGGLNVQTEYGPDTFGPATPAVTWWYHVAPIIRVRLNPATVQEMVMDPSIFSSPSPIDQWMDRMTNPIFTRMTVDQIRTLYTASGGWPVNQPLVYTTGRDVYYPNDILGPAATPISAEGQHAGNLPRIKSYAILAKVHELAADIRRIIAVPPVAAAVLIAAIRGFPLATRMQLWMGRADPGTAGWNDLWRTILTAVPNAADRTAVEDSFTNP